MKHRKPLSLFSMLICLTLLFIAAQLSFFFIHEQLYSIIDVVTKSAIFSGRFNATIWLPIVAFVALQLLAYFLLVCFIWFVAVAISEPFPSRAKKIIAYGLGISLWLVCAFLILILNSRYYPHSFFAPHFSNKIGLIKPLLIAVLSAIALAYFNCLVMKSRRLLGGFFLLLVIIAFVDVNPFAANVNTKDDDHLIYISDKSWLASKKSPEKKWLQTDASVSNNQSNSKKLNIIFIGLDSLRPDYIHAAETPNVNRFLQRALTFTDAYTPLARTFPSWISILTAQYPKHNHARINLDDPVPVINEENLANHLQKLGYETIYATDEKRFSNISEDYGFDHIVGPSMGVNDFLLGSLSDFPLTNLMVHLPISRFLFPYHYANRAVAITYEPYHFLNLVRQALNQRQQQKPLFLAIHLCVSHWPYFKAGDKLDRHITFEQQYIQGTQSVDAQLGDLIHLLNQHELLKNTLVILLSDHGTGLGLPGDRLLTTKNYLGDPKKLALITHYKRSDNQQFTISTSYGQGTDVLSLKQYHVVLAFKGFGFELPQKQITRQSSLLDIAPTVLDFAHLAPLTRTDGISLLPLFMKENVATNPETHSPLRPFFIETADTIGAIETDKISIEKVLKQRIHAYKINPKTALLSIDPLQEDPILKNKQRAILLGDWLFAFYPPKKQEKFVIKNKRFVIKVFDVPGYTVLINLKTGLWTIDLSSPWAKTAPLDTLKQSMKSFYGNEVMQT